MAKYAVFFKMTGETINRMIDHPSDRRAMVNRAAEQVGGRLEAYYWMFGPHDGIVIIEAPDSVSAASVSVAVASTGAFDHMETRELIDARDIGAVLDKAKSVRQAYQPPGA